MNLYWIGIIAALGSAASWAIGALLIKPIAERIPAINLALIKSIIAVIVLEGVRRIYEIPIPSQEVSIILLLSGVLGVGIADTLFFKALGILSSYTVVQLMLVGQVLTIALAVIFLDERLNWIEWLGILFVLIGVTVIIKEPNKTKNSFNHSRGILYGLGSVFAMAISITLAKNALAEAQVLSATLIRMLGGTLALGIFIPIFHGKNLVWLSLLIKDWRIVIQFAAIATVITFGGFFLSLVAVKYTPLAIANTLLSTEPLFVLLIGALFFQQLPNARSILGSGIGVAGIGLLSSKGFI